MASKALISPVPGLQEAHVTYSVTPINSTQVSGICFRTCMFFLSPVLKVICWHILRYLPGLLCFVSQTATSLVLCCMVQSELGNTCPSSRTRPLFLSPPPLTMIVCLYPGRVYLATESKLHSSWKAGKVLIYGNEMEEVSDGQPISSAHELRSLRGGGRTCPDFSAAVSGFSSL